MIVDDEHNIHYSFKKILLSGYHLDSAHTAEDGLEKLRTDQYDLVVMDVKLPGMDGLEALRHVREIDARVPVIMTTAYGTVNTTITAMKFGAFEYLPKPFDVDKIRQTIKKALAQGDLMRRSVYIPDDAPDERDEAGDVIVGSSDVMQEVYKLIGQIAEQDVTVLIRGESGTGKELVTRAIYHHSKRADKPFFRNKLCRSS